MQTYKDLLTEKTRIRLTDPDRFEVLTMILDGASKIAKREQREVEEKDLISAVKSEISSTEKAIDLIKSKNGDASKQEAELAIYKLFLPTPYTEEETEKLVKDWINAFKLELTKKNAGKLISEFKNSLTLRSDIHADAVDMKIATKILLSMTN